MLDLGIGLSHLNEQYEPVFGGEMDVLDKPSGLPTTWNQLYQLANGPIEDIGGWVDGTCIYYLLVQLPFKDQSMETRLSTALLATDESEIPDELFRRRYCILWIDEQQAFTERWRVLGLEETDYAGLVTPVSSFIADGDYNNTYHFSPEHFTDPFINGWIRSFSVMAVARQVILVNGFERSAGVSGKHRLYSIHFSWPTMDRSWRYRELPDGIPVRIYTEAERAAGDEPVETGDEHVYVQTLRLREDMFIYLKGTMRVGQQILKGRFVQRYLPADNQERPGEQVFRDEAPRGLHEGYTHPWQFYEESVFLVMHREYSHFGVYEPVSSRCQFYRISIEGKTDPDPAIISGTTWMDNGQALKKSRREINYSKAGDVLNQAVAAIAIDILVAAALALVTQNSIIGLLAFFGLLLAELGLSFAYIIDSKTHPSLYENRLRFRIIPTTTLGYIMVYADKREDKNVSFDNIPRTVRLVAANNEGLTLSVQVHNHSRSRRAITVREKLGPPEVQEATVTLRLGPGGNPAYIIIRFTTARTEADFDTSQEWAEWIKCSIAAVKIGLPRTLHSTNIICHYRMLPNDYVPVTASNVFGVMIKVSPADLYYNDLVRLFTNESKVTTGIGLWFTGITGYVSIPGTLLFEQVQDK